MSEIAYYISSHGYGHAARQQAVIKHLAQQGLAVHVRTASPRKFFKDAASYHHQRYDIGMIQQDALHFDIPASLNWMTDFLAGQEAIITRELAFIAENNIKLIVSDMPPLACEIASRVGIPSVVVTHFTWDWVYEHYLETYPQAEPIVEMLRAQYNKVTLALQMQLPLPHPFDMFSTVEPVPLIYNAPTQSREAIRAQFAIPDELPMVLLSMGGHHWGDSNIRALLDYEDAFFLVMPGAWEQVEHNSGHFRKVPMDFDDYHNLIAAADLIVGKAGGSTVAEVLGHRTPMIYTTQGNAQWRESQLLAETLDTYASAYYIPMPAFMAGDWIDLLPDVLNTTHHWREIDRNGAHQACNRLLRLINSVSLE